MTDGTSMPPSGLVEGRERLMPLVLAALALAWVVLSIEPFPVGVFQDDGIYTLLAKSLATGQGYRYLHLPEAPNATHFPPLYPLVLAGFWKLAPAFPANVTLFKFVNAGFIALAAFFAWHFARRQAEMGRWAAFLAAGAFTVCTPMVVLGVMVLSEPMFLAALFPVLMACERAARTGNRRDALVAGAVGGALALVRTLGAVTIPVTALVLAWRRRWGAALLVCVAGAVVMLPWQAWVAAHATELPPVLLGKYGSYSTWLLEGVRAGGIGWVADLVEFNLRLLVGQGWATLAVESFPIAVQWAAIVVCTALFVGGWIQLVRRAPVAAWTALAYMALVIAWPFPPDRFAFGIWPLLGLPFGMAIESLFTWRPRTRPASAMRLASLATAGLLVLGYARYNYLNTANGWWTRVQQGVADRARPLAEWVNAYTPADALISTEDDVLVHLYTGRRTVPLGAFTTNDHMSAQTPAFSSQTLRTILRTYDVSFVLASTEFGTRAALGLVRAQPPELVPVGALKLGAIYRPVTSSGAR